MQGNTFQYVTYIRTSPEQLWEALTTAEATREYWHGMSIQSDFEVGAKIQMSKSTGVPDWHGVILEIKTHEVLVFTWHFPQIQGKEPEVQTKVCWMLEPHGPVMRLTLEHSGFPDGSPVFQVVAKAWPVILSSLKSLLETGEPLEL